MLDQLIYMSKASSPDAKQVEAILKSARRKNRQLGITGVLVLFDDTFIQILEGPREAVSSLFNVIKKDKRHNEVMELSVQPIDERAFGDWAMAFVEKTPEDIRELLRGESIDLALDERLKKLSTSHQWIVDFLVQCQQS